MKFRTKLSIALLALLGAGSLWNYATATGTDRFGPVTCSSCHLGRPDPDATTKVFLKSFEQGITGKNPITNGPRLIAGDVIVVCNGTGCVDYQKTETDNYEGVKYRQQNTTPPGGGAGGGTGGTGGSGGGSGPISGGCHLKCNGEVTVGA